MANLRANRITSTEVFETTGSVQFDGSGDYLSLASSEDFAVGTGDFTVEFWTYPTVRTTYEPYFVVGVTGGLWIGKYQNNFVLRSFNVADYIQVSTLPELNTWTHIAVTRSNSTARIFYNGVEVGSASNNYDFVQGAARIANDTSTNYVTGHISNLRVLKGTALYTSDFTPPTRELEVIPNTVLLCAQSTTNAAEEKTGKTITVNGNAVANELTPGLLTNVVKSGGSSAITGSVEFNGGGAGQNTSYLQFPVDDDLILSGDFTIELWIRPGSIASSGSYHIFANQAQDITFQYSNSDTNVIVYDGLNRTLGSLDKGEWAHVAIVRSGSTLQAYKNGNKFGASWTNSSTTRFTFSSTLLGSRWQTGNNFDGFISNLRIIKGTALYTSNFIPPTRKLTKLPGTVLLCCQDSNDPTTEATGKTITGYGDLERTSTERVINGTFDSDSNWSKGNGWSITGGSATHSGPLAGTISQDIITVPGKKYIYTIDVSNINGPISLRWEDIAFNYPNSAGTYSFEVTASGSLTDVSVYAPADRSVTIDNFSVKPAYESTASDFTPSVGSDGSVEFAGPTTINTENYFYLPTGPTEQRGRGRGVFGGGYISSGLNTIEYVNIQSTGNGKDFGDLTDGRFKVASLASSTRGLFAGGWDNLPNFNIIDYVTIATTSNAVNFGDLTAEKRNSSSLSNTTRGIIAGGDTPTTTNIIDYVTIASLGDATTFGELITSGQSLSGGVSSPTRGVFGGGSPGITTLQYITITSTGNAQNFGDLTVSKQVGNACSSATRGIFGGAQDNTIDYITISTEGNAQDFGDMSVDRALYGAASNSIKGIFGGGRKSPNNYNTIDYITIASTGNAQDFGDLTQVKYYVDATSDSHGGLG